MTSNAHPPQHARFHRLAAIQPPIGAIGRTDERTIGVLAVAVVGRRETAQSLFPAFAKTDDGLAGKFQVIRDRKLPLPKS
jgi:hypothetical protein